MDFLKDNLTIANMSNPANSLSLSMCKLVAFVILTMASLVNDCESQNLYAETLVSSYKHPIIMKIFAPVHKWDGAGVILAPSSETIHKYCFLGDLFTSDKDEYVRILLVSLEHFYVLCCWCFVHVFLPLWTKLYDGPCIGYTYTQVTTMQGAHAMLLFSHCCVQLFATPWTADCWSFLSFTISQSLLKLKFIKLMIPSNHLIL